MMATHDKSMSDANTNDLGTDTEVSLSLTPCQKPPATPCLGKQSTTTLIDDSGMCLACGDINTEDRSIECLLCHKTFHAICRSSSGGMQNVLCTKTFFDLFVKRVEKNDTFSGVFSFVCDTCLTNHEQKQASSLKSHVQVLEQKVESMESNIKDIKSLLMDKNKSSQNSQESIPVNEINLSSSSPSSAWNNEAGLKKVKSFTPIIVKKNSSGAHVPDSDLEKIVTDNKIQVKRSYKNKSGDNVILVSSSRDRQILTTKLAETFPVHEVVQPPERLPTISLANMFENLPVNDLKDKVLSMHDEIASMVATGSIFDILYIRPQKKGNRYQACIRVSNDIRKFIENIGDRLYLGMYSCNVYDHFYVKRCNNCQKYHHYHDKCKASKPTCAKCAGDHSTKDCHTCNNEDFVPTCINCKHEKSTFSHTHEATSRECPSYQAAQDKLRKSIQFYDSKNI